MLRGFYFSLFIEIERLQEMSNNSITFFSSSQEIEIVCSGIRSGFKSRNKNPMNFCSKRHESLVYDVLNTRNVEKNDLTRSRSVTVRNFT